LTLPNKGLGRISPQTGNTRGDPLKACLFHILPSDNKLPVKRDIPKGLPILYFYMLLPVLVYAQAPPIARVEPLYEVIVEKNILVPVRDGIRLALDIYRPGQNGSSLAGRFPTVLVRTPYDKSGNLTEGEYFASRGYVLVANDTRGRFRSEGKWRMMLDDPTDGYDMVEWIARQSWSDGKVGTMGGSYVGGTQHALACLNPPHLTTMIPADALSNCGVAGMRHSGAFELRFMNWIFSIGAPNSQAALKDPVVKTALSRNAELMRQHIWHLPVKKGTTALKFAPEYEDFLIEAMSHGDNDAYWKQPGLSVIDNLNGYADVPVYHVTGWYDSWTRQVIMNYAALSVNKRSPQRLIVGPWTHGGQGSAFAGEMLTTVWIKSRPFCCSSWVAEVEESRVLDGWNRAAIGAPRESGPWPGLDLRLTICTRMEL
jgi:uncharacterized protein